MVDILDDLINYSNIKAYDGILDRHYVEYHIFYDLFNQLSEIELEGIYYDTESLSFKVTIVPECRQDIDAIETDVESFDISVCNFTETPNHVISHERIEGGVVINISVV